MDGTRKYAWPPGQYLTVLARSFFGAGRGATKEAHGEGSPVGFRNSAGQRPAFLVVARPWIRASAPILLRDRSGMDGLFAGPSLRQPGDHFGRMKDEGYRRNQSRFLLQPSSFIPSKKAHGFASPSFERVCPFEDERRFDPGSTPQRAPAAITKSDSSVAAQTIGRVYHPGKCLGESLPNSASSAALPSQFSRRPRAGGRPGAGG